MASKSTTKTTHILFNNSPKSLPSLYTGRKLFHNHRHIHTYTHTHTHTHVCTHLRRHTADTRLRIRERLTQCSNCQNGGAWGVEIFCRWGVERRGRGVEFFPPHGVEKEV